MVLQQCNLFDCPDLIRIKKQDSAFERIKKQDSAFEFKGSTLKPDLLPLTVNAISVTPTRIAAFTMPLNNERSERQRAVSDLNLTNNKKKVDVSEKARKNMQRAVSFFVYSARKKIFSKKGAKVDTVLKMITLTLSGPQKHNDVFVKDNLLDKFIDWLKYEYKVINYIWKAERQGNGNVHFHLLINTYIPYVTIQNKWNYIQAKYGYLNEFLIKRGHSDPHSTEIKNGKKAKSLISYISKYFSKKNDVESVPIEGKTWFCSKGLQGIGSLVLNEIDHEFTKQFDGLLKRFNNCKVLFLDHCAIYCIDFMQFDKDENFCFFDLLLKDHIKKKGLIT